MQNRETILNKIELQQKEWDKQIEFLQSKLVSFDTEKRYKMEKYVNHLNEKLRLVQKRTNELKYANVKIWDTHGDSILICWEELVHNVDFVIYNYKKIFNK